MEGVPVAIRVTVGPEPIDPGALVAEVGHPGAGAVVAFLGTVRDHSPGKTGVTHLDYEVYAEAVGDEIRKVIDQAVGRWPLLAVVVEHRTGTVLVGEASVAVVVAAAHRQEAFPAAAFVIDELKRTAPIWKKEFWPGGSEWSRGS